MKKCIISHLTFSFNGQTKPFFCDVHVTFEQGKLYFVQGKNGVGKSTLFSILQGTTSHNSVLTGTITYNNHDYCITNNHMPHEISAVIKTVVQDSFVMIAPSMTVEENLKLAQLSTYPLPIPLSHSQHIPELIKEFNINPTTTARYLSGGQKQILAIIMALQKPTQILLLDEPTAALDAKNSTLVMNFLKTLAQELQLIVLIITHDQDVVQQYGTNKNITITEDENDVRRVKQE